MKSVPMRLGEIAQLIFARVDAACRHFVQQRLPDVRPSAIDQRDVRLPTPAQTVAETSGKLQPSGAAADHDDPVQLLRGAQ